MGSCLAVLKEELLTLHCGGCRSDQQLLTSLELTLTKMDRLDGKTETRNTVTEPCEVRRGKQMASEKTNVPPVRSQTQDKQLRCLWPPGFPSSPPEWHSRPLP